jgi:rhodanese-related sulfurtransferase
MEELSPLEANTLLENNVLLVDVREVDELAVIAYDVKNLLNVPLSEFEQRFSEIPKDQKVIFACRAGVRSARAIQFLAHNGYDAAFLINLEGGMNAWQGYGLKTK